MNLEDYVHSTLSIVEDEYPSMFEDILTLIGPDRVLFGVDGESVVLNIETNKIRVTSPEGYPSVDLESMITRPIMYGILDGKMTLAEGLLEPDFLVKGHPSIILRFFRIVEILLYISQRSARFIDLFNQFRYAST